MSLNFIFESYYKYQKYDFNYINILPNLKCILFRKLNFIEYINFST